MSADCTPLYIQHGSASGTICSCTVCGEPYPVWPEHIHTCINDHDAWIPANGRTEQVFDTQTGRRLLYVWQPSSGNHAYLDTQTDLILTDEEARLALGTF